MGTRYSEFNKMVGSSLQSLRKRAGYKSATSFAKYLGINPSTYTDYEQGKASLSYERAWEIADALDCTLDALGGRTPPKRDYADQRQQSLNHCYGMLDERSKSELAGLASTMTADASRLAVKSGEDTQDMGLSEAM